MVDPAGCTESTTSTTDGQNCGGESSKTKTPSSSSDTSEEPQVNQSVAYATLSAPLQVQEELEGVRDLNLNDFESLLGKPWLQYLFQYQPYIKIKGFLAGIQLSYVLGIVNNLQYFLWCNEMFAHLNNDNHFQGPPGCKKFK